MSAPTPIPVSRLALPGDFDELTRIGYDINLSSKEAADFVNRYFKNLDLLKWAEESEVIFGKLGAPPITRNLELSDGSPPEIHLQFLDKNYKNVRSGLAIYRRLTNSNGSIAVHHEYLSLPESVRGKQISKRFFASSLQQYVNLDIDGIYVKTGLTHGGLVWAGYGFLATDRNDMEKILLRASEMLTGTEFARAKRIFENYYSKEPYGERFPIERWYESEYMEPVLMGSEWRGIIDFKNRDQLFNFIGKCTLRT